MTDFIDRQKLGSAPDAGNLRILVQDVFESVVAVRERLRVDAEKLANEEARLAALQVKLDDERHEHESQCEAVARQAQEIDRRQADLDQFRLRIESDAQSVAEQMHQLKLEIEQLEQMKQNHANVDSELRRREQALRTGEAELLRQAKAIEPQRQELGQREKDLAERAAKLELHAEELVRTRETLVAMQAQLNRDHQEVAAQRQELLRRLASTPETAGGHEPVPELYEPAVAQSSWSGGPKPAAAGGVDQFRKLRRDAKRRAIGV